MILISESMNKIKVESKVVQQVNTIRWTTILFNLSTCDLYSIKTDLKSIKGSTISSLQASEVCHLLGIKVED